MHVNTGCVGVRLRVFACCVYEHTRPQPDFVLAVKAFEWIGGRPCDAIGDPADLDAEPEVVALLHILLNEDGDEHRIPQSQQVCVCVCPNQRTVTGFIINMDR